MNKIILKNKLSIITAMSGNAFFKGAIFSNAPF